VAPRAVDAATCYRRNQPSGSSLSRGKFTGAVWDHDPVPSVLVAATAVTSDGWVVRERTGSTRSLLALTTAVLLGVRTPGLVFAQEVSPASSPDDRPPPIR
jgi:hypothetical protein